MENWVNVYATDRIYLAEIAKEVLFDNGIQAVIINKKDSAYLFGFIELHVKQEQALKARHILDKLDKTPDAGILP